MMKVLKVYDDITRHSGNLLVPGEVVHIADPRKEGDSPCGNFSFSKLRLENRLYTFPSDRYSIPMCEICRRHWVVYQLGE